MKRFLKISAAIFVIIIAFTGCKKHELQDIDQNTLVFYEDGTVKAVSIEEFDKDHYSKKELEKFVKGEVSAFNASAGSNSVVLERLKIKKDSVQMIMKYKDVATYTALTKNQLILTTFAELGSQKLSIPDSFMMATGGTIGIEDLRDVAAEQKVLIVTEPVHIDLRGQEITYYSEASEVSGGEANVNQADSAAFIIFKLASKSK